MQKEAEKAGRSGNSLYSKRPVFAVAPMIDWTDFPSIMGPGVLGSIFVANH